MNRELEQKLIEQVKRDPLSLKDIQVQTERICLAAVKVKGLALLYVKNQTEKYAQKLSNKIKILSIMLRIKLKICV